MQPYVFSRSGNWIVRYRQTVNESGTLKTVQRAKILCHTSGVSKKKARQLGKQEVEKLEQARPPIPEKMVRLGDYVTNVYMPLAKSRLRNWTVRSYRSMWERHFEPRPHITSRLLCEVETGDVCDWLSEIVATDKAENGELLGIATVKRMKSLLSGVFKHATNRKYVKVNPVVGTELPTATPPKETAAYSLEQIRAMIASLPDQTSRVMIAVAAFTGLSRAEIRGLEWEAIQGQELHVLRSIVAGKVQDTKTRARKAPVPLLSSLAMVLEEYRKNNGKHLTGPIFRTGTGNPIDPNNLLRDRMKPAFKKAEITFWSGWHGFRRGIATNLHRLGVQDKVIQGILRHSNVSVTQACYIKTANQDSVRALESLDAVLCSNCALESTNPVTAHVQ